MTKNLQAYVKLALKESADKYAVLVDGKLIGTGTNLKALLRKAHKNHPGKIPAVGKVPGPTTLILRLRVAS